ncbi:hypothetical protein [Rufibacter sp. XAAS-G3-1]|uniref:hypothetical protein n=1 Tax=Rufibacter sp. XAAS-G3-1 TaxID=2729134 RepID=UPI0015E6C215|nr:hypothetical protein [Rufibacter sp. XAAS-G3-1]
MKKLILSAFLLGAVYTAQAQTNLTGAAATSRAVLSMSAQEMSRQMYNELQLNEGQYIKLRALNQARFDKFSEIEKMYGNDAQMRDAKIKEVNQQLDQEFAQVLTPKQFTAYLEMDGRAVAVAPSSSSTEMGASSTNVSAGSTGTEVKVEEKVKVEGDKKKIKTETTKKKVKN